MAETVDLSLKRSPDYGLQLPLDELQQPHRSTSGGAKDIVLLGGGTGLSGVTEGLSNEPYTGHGVVSVVTTFDDGGGTGELRRKYGIPAVGDVRQSLRAQSRHTPKLLSFLEGRFDEGNPSEDLLYLRGQPAGNIIIARAIIAEMEEGGNFTTALVELGELYQIKGKVLPVSNDIRNIRFELPNGHVIHGEHEADVAKHIPSLEGTNIRFVNPETGRIKQANISEEVEAAIEHADMVVLAPGDLYTSIGPNLAVRGMREALKRANAVVMVANLMNKAWHTKDFTALTIAQEYERIGGIRIDRILVNEEPLDEAALQDQREKDGSNPVEPDFEGLEKAGYEVRAARLLSHDVVKSDPRDKTERSEIRHDPAKVAAALHDIYQLNGFSRS